LAIEVSYKTTPGRGRKKKPGELVAFVEPIVMPPKFNEIVMDDTLLSNSVATNNNINIITEPIIEPVIEVEIICRQFFIRYDV